MNTIENLYEKLKECPKHTIAVAAAADTEVLSAVADARRKGMVNAALFGKAEEIENCLAKIGEKKAYYMIRDCKDSAEAAEKAVKSVSSGEFDILMKGLLPSGDFLRAVLNKDYGLRMPDRILSSVAVLQIHIEDEDRLLFLTDPGFIPLPDLETKVKIIENLTEGLGKLGYEEPKIAVLSAMETVNPKILSSVEAKELEERNKKGGITGCIIGGPLSMDLALSKKSAEHKRFCHPVAGQADAILVPSLEVGNAVLKCITYLTECPTAGFVCGTSKPVVFTSRSDSARTKLNSIALAVLMAE